MAISVNMLRWRVRSEAQPRCKDGQPAHRTTGVAKANCSQGSCAIENQLCSGTPIIGNIREQVLEKGLKSVKSGRRPAMEKTF